MSVRTTGSSQTVDGVLTDAVMQSTLDDPLSEANSFSAVDPEHPLHRTFQVNIKASLNDLCLQRGKDVWEPSSEHLKKIFQHKKCARPRSRDRALASGACA
jgi:hypothetical protein